MRRRSEVTQAPETKPAAEQQTLPAAAHEHADTERPPSHQKEFEPPVLPRGYSRICSWVFDLPDPADACDKLRQAIRPIKPSRLQHGELCDKLDIAQENFVEASQLLANAKVAVANYEVEARLVLGPMRDAASEELEDEKASGKRKKAITNDDIEHRMATLYPDQVMEIEQSRNKLKHMVAVLEDLRQAASERARDVRAIVSTSRSV
jgi:hypothetical protein